MKEIEFMEIQALLNKMELKQSYYMYAKLRMEADINQAKHPELLTEGTKKSIKDALEVFQVYR